MGELAACKDGGKRAHCEPCCAPQSSASVVAATTAGVPSLTTRAHRSLAIIQSCSACVVADVLSEPRADAGLIDCPVTTIDAKGSAPRDSELRWELKEIAMPTSNAHPDSFHAAGHS